MNTPIVRKLVLTTEFQPLATSSTVGNFTFRAPSSGMGFLLGDDGVTEVPLDRSQEFTLHGVDLSQLQAKSTGLADYLVIIGATRTI